MQTLLAAYLASPTEQNGDRVRKYAKKHPMSVCFCIEKAEVAALKLLGLA